MKHNILFAPCPFCGNTDLKFSDREFFEEQVERSGSFCLGVSCEKCDVEMYVHREKTYDQAINDLLQKWNRRGPKNAD